MTSNHGRFGPTDLVGRKLNNKYYVRRRLPKAGGMCTLYLAEDTEDTGGANSEKYVIKVLRPEYATDPDFRGQLAHEYQLMRTLVHTNIVRVYEYHEEPEYDLYYLVMEYVDGPDLESFLVEQGTLSEEHALTIVVQALEGLKYAQERGIIHRDFKLSNILLGPDGVIKLADFGIGEVLTRRSIAAAGKALGTAAYISPQVALGQPPAYTDDVYSAGVTLYQVLTGRLPFEADDYVEQARMHIYVRPTPPREINPLISPWLNDLITQALAKSPDKRPSDAGALIKALNPSFARRAVAYVLAMMRGIRTRKAAPNRSAWKGQIVAPVEPASNGGRVSPSTPGAPRLKSNLTIDATVAITQQLNLAEFTEAAQAATPPMALPPTSVMGVSPRSGDSLQSALRAGQPPLSIYPSIPYIDGGVQFNGVTAEVTLRIVSNSGEEGSISVGQGAEWLEATPNKFGADKSDPYAPQEVRVLIRPQLAPEPGKEYRAALEIFLPSLDFRTFLPVVFTRAGGVHVVLIVDVMGRLEAVTRHTTHARELIKALKQCLAPHGELLISLILYRDWDHQEPMLGSNPARLFDGITPDLAIQVLVEEEAHLKEIERRIAELEAVLPALKTDPNKLEEYERVDDELESLEQQVRYQDPEGAFEEAVVKLGQVSWHPHHRGVVITVASRAPHPLMPKPFQVRAPRNEALLAQGTPIEKQKDWKALYEETIGPLGLRAFCVWWPLHWPHDARVVRPRFNEARTYQAECWHEVGVHGGWAWEETKVTAEAIAAAIYEDLLRTCADARVKVTPHLTPLAASAPQPPDSRATATPPNEQNPSDATT